MGTKQSKGAKEKPLDKMTAKELRDIAKEIPEITGVYGMNKTELLSAVKKARGIKEEVGRRSNASVRDIKKQIRKLKNEREKALERKDAKMAAIYRKRVIRLKKKTRRAA